MSREIDPRFIPKQWQVNIDRQRWVIIGRLPEKVMAKFWQQARVVAPEVIRLRKEGGQLFGIFNAVFQIPEKRYHEIMEAKT